MWLQFEIWSNISYNTNVPNSLSPFITLIFHGKHYPTLSTLCTATAASTRQSLGPSLNPVIGQKSWYSPVMGPLWDVHPPHGSNYVNFIWTDIYAFLYHHWSCDQMWYIYSYIHTINLTAMNKSESVIKRHPTGPKRPHPGVQTRNFVKWQWLARSPQKHNICDTDNLPCW